MEGLILLILSTGFKCLTNTQWSQRYRCIDNDLIFLHLSMMFCGCNVVFVYSKSEYTLESVSMSVCPSGRLHDNFLKVQSIVMKFSTHHYLINISAEFEDEPNSPRIYWVSASSILIFCRILCKYLSIKIYVNQSFCHS
jgi:hypothetical protein